jgi:hypothetical protein
MLERAVEIHIQYVKWCSFSTCPREAVGDSTQDNRGVLSIFGDSIEYESG